MNEAGDLEFEGRLEALRRRIEAACARAGRSPESVNLLAVTKTCGPDRVRQAAGAGLTCFGESRIQEARQKIGLLPASLTWHFIGHLQTNKAREAVRLFHLVQGVDSEKLLLALESAAEAQGRTLPVFLEINVSGEGSKFGLAPEAAPAVLRAADRLRRIEIQGLMTIPPAAPDPGQARPFFRRLRELRDAWRRDTGYELAELSMGMSGDFEVAIEEGATWVRVGTALFGARRMP